MTGNFEKSERARLALKHRLYHHPTWHLRGHLKLAMLQPELYHIELAYANDVPVAVAIVRHSKYNRCVKGQEPTASHRRLSRCKTIGVQIFVKKEYRRQGHGAALLKKLTEQATNKDFRASKGIEGSDDFWRKHNVKPWHHDAKSSPQDWKYW